MSSEQLERECTSGVQSSDFQAAAAGQKRTVPSWTHREVLEEKPRVSCMSEVYRCVSHLILSSYVCALSRTCK